MTICYNIANVVRFGLLLLLLLLLFFQLRGMWDVSSLTMNWTHTPCIGRQSLNSWTSREVPYFLKNLFSQCPRCLLMYSVQVSSLKPHAWRCALAKEWPPATSWLCSFDGTSTFRRSHQRLWWSREASYPLPPTHPQDSGRSEDSGNPGRGVTNERSLKTFCYKWAQRSCSSESRRCVYSHVDFNQWFIESCSNSIGMDSRTHHYPMALSTSVLNFLLIFQTQVREKVGGWTV